MNTPMLMNRLTTFARSALTLGAIVLATLYVMGCVSPMQRGQDAYDAGDHAAAIAQWQPLAEAAMPARRCCLA